MGSLRASVCGKAAPRPALYCTALCCAARVPSAHSFAAAELSLAFSFASRSSLSSCATRDAASRPASPSASRPCRSAALACASRAERRSSESRKRSFSSASWPAAPPAVAWANFLRSSSRRVLRVGVG